MSSWKAASGPRVDSLLSGTTGERLLGLPPVEIALWVWAMVLRLEEHATSRLCSRALSVSFAFLAFCFPFNSPRKGPCKAGVAL
eukprot:16168894-Heterocapsa_arctica.AAC.1